MLNTRIQLIAWYHIIAASCLRRLLCDQVRRTTAYQSVVCRRSHTESQATSTSSTRSIFSSKTSSMMELLLVSISYTRRMGCLLQRFYRGVNHGGAGGRVPGDEAPRIWSGDADANCPQILRTRTKIPLRGHKTRHFKRKKSLFSGDGLDPSVGGMVPLPHLIPRPNQPFWIGPCVHENSSQILRL